VVIGSWYSSSSETSNNNRAALRLGTRFHRSGIQLITSQVSSISATISDRWDKARRFNTVWGVIRRCRPSRLLRLGGHVVAHRGKCTVYVCTVSYYCTIVLMCQSINFALLTLTASSTLKQVSLQTNHFGTQKLQKNLSNP
jgi:hypothetical protein